MRYSQSEKMEVIRLMRGSSLSVRRTLSGLDVARSTFYCWYAAYAKDGYDGLASKAGDRQRFWNRIPDEFKHKTRRVHELWQTDFPYMKVIGWGWYYLSTGLDDYSRYIIAWELKHFVEHYNHERYHEALGNLTPADKYHGRHREITTARTLAKIQTLERRRRVNLGLKVKKEEPIIPAELRESVY